MKNKYVWLLVSGLLVAALLLSACGPAVTEKEKAEEEEKEVVVVEKKAAEQFVWLDQGGWVRPEFVDDVKEMAPNVYLVYPYNLEEPQYGGVLTFARAGDPSGFDPWSTGGGGQAGYTHETLFTGEWTTPHEVWPMVMSTYVPNTVKVGWLAESWEMPDDQTVIFHLRKGIKFNNGLKAARAFVGDREFVADDVVKCYSRWLGLYGRPPSQGERSVGQYIDAIEALDKYTVRIHIDRYNMAFFYSQACMTSSQIFPMEIVDKYGDYSDWRTHVSTAAFYVSDYVRGVSLYLKANEEYWGTGAIYGKDYPLPFLAGIKELIIPDEATRIVALRTGKTDYLTVDFKDVAPLHKSNPELHWRQTAVTGGRRLDLRKDKWPWDQLKFRQALWMAMNHQAMIDSFWGGDGVAPSYPFVPDSLGEFYMSPSDMPKEPTVKYNPGGGADGVAEPGNTLCVQADSTVSAYEIWNWTPENPAKARALLDEVLGPGVEYNCVFDAVSTGDIDQIEAIVAFWKAIGINGKITYHEAAVLSRLKSDKSFTDVLVTSGGITYPFRVISWYVWGGVPINLLSPWNSAITRDKLYDVMVANIVEVPGSEESKLDLMWDLQTYYNETLICSSIPAPTSYFFFQPWVKGGFKGSMGTCYYHPSEAYRHLWIDQDLKTFLAKK